MRIEDHNITMFELTAEKKAFIFLWMLSMPVVLAGLILMLLAFSSPDTLSIEFYVLIFAFILVGLLIFTWQKFQWIIKGKIKIESNSIVLESENRSEGLKSIPLNESVTIWKEKVNYFFFPPLSRHLYFLLLRYPDRGLHSIKIIGIGNQEKIDMRLQELSFK